jgi:hypothetical protein
MGGFQTGRIGMKRIAMMMAIAMLMSAAITRAPQPKF